MRRAILVALGLGLIALLMFPKPQLVIEDAKGGKKIAAFPLNWGEQFEICYIHSVDLTPVCEIFSLHWRHGIVLHETYFRKFGAGMGHWEGHGRVVDEGEWIKIKDIEKPLGRFLLRVGTQGVDHTLRIGNTTLNLSKTLAGRLVVVKREMDALIRQIMRRGGGDHHG
ncbi:MAG: DUF1850 domain-containing protein [Deltaproteobacteria bacterium]|nr:DUF1850 domain-containing protein [Deltaproteobacteria bacterium]